MATFSTQITSPNDRLDVLARVLDSLNRPMRGQGYKLETQTPEQVVWRRSWLAALLRSPLAILWIPLAALKGVDRVTMSLADSTAGGTVITVAGTGPRRLARAFADLSR